jgi:heme/copper-type cytochrome/quinol oxidase subunit 2
MPHAQQAPQEYGQRRPQDGNNLGWAALSLAIFGLALFWIPMVYPVAGIAAIVLGALGYSRARAGTATNGRAAIAGMVLGIIAVVLPAAVLIGFAFYAASSG